MNARLKLTRSAASILAVGALLPCCATRRHFTDAAAGLVLKEVSGHIGREMGKSIAPAVGLMLALYRQLQEFHRDHGRWPINGEEFAASPKMKNSPLLSIQWQKVRFSERKDGQLELSLVDISPGVFLTVGKPANSN